MTGHLAGRRRRPRSGITALALRDQILPPTINLENQTPGRATWILSPITPEKPLSNTNVELLGFGGTNTNDPKKTKKHPMGRCC